MALGPIARDRLRFSGSIRYMRGAILGTVGLILGALAALGYSHYCGEGKQLADLQGQVAQLQSDLTAAKETNKLAKSENDALTDQVQKLITTKNELQKQVGTADNSAPGLSVPMPPGFTKSDMAGIVKAQMAQMNDQKLQMLEARLHLTPDQIAKIKAAMDAESERTEHMTDQMFSGQKVDLQSMTKDAGSFKSADQVIQGLLTPDQKTAYQQMQNEEKTSSAESLASMQMNQVAPLLNLSETQKDQVESVLYQAQLDSEDPKWIQKNSANTVGDPTALLDVEEKAKEDALASVLTPDQLATYKQQAESQLNMQRAMMKKFMPAGGFSAGVSGSTSAPAGSVPGTPVPVSSASAAANSSPAPNP